MALLASISEETDESFEEVEMTSFLGTTESSNDNNVTTNSADEEQVVGGNLDDGSEHSHQASIARARWARCHLILVLMVLAAIDLSWKAISKGHGTAGRCICDSTGLCFCDEKEIPATKSQETNRVLVGSDFSEVLHALRNNVTYYDVDGTEKDPLDTFAAHGYTWARLRIMVDPPGNYGLNQDLPYVKEMARSIERLGMKLLLDFHFSHWWADPGQQWVPNSWKAATGDPNDVAVEVLEADIYDHVYEVMKELKGQGTVPHAVQIGNEINSGLLWETARVNISETKSMKWNNLARCTNSALRAMSDILLTKNGVGNLPKIVVHLASGGESTFTQSWLEAFINAGGQFDIIGLSYYPMWHGSLDDLSANLKNLAGVFPSKNVWVVETAYYWTKSYDEGILPFPQTPDGQVEYLHALRAVLDEYTSSVGKETAVFYWGSHWAQPEKWMNTSETWEDAGKRALVDQNGRTLKGIDAVLG